MFLNIIVMFLNILFNIISSKKTGVGILRLTRKSVPGFLGTNLK